MSTTSLIYNAKNVLLYGGIRLVPGPNTVPEAAWAEAMKNPIIRARVERGVIVVKSGPVAPAPKPVEAEAEEAVASEVVPVKRAGPGRPKKAKPVEEIASETTDNDGAA